MSVMCQHPGCAESDSPNPACGGTRLCGLHLRGLQADVADIERVTGLLTDAHGDLVASTSGDGGGARTVPSSRPPLRLAVVLPPATVQAVTGWASDLLRTEGTMTLQRAGQVLGSHADIIACHVEVAVIAPELREAATDCRAVLPDDRWNTPEQDERPRSVGRCTMPHLTEPDRVCGGPLMWVRSTLVVRCGRCQHEQEPDGWVAKRVVLRAFGLPKSTLNRWISLGRVGATETLVCVDDVRTLMRARHAIEDGA